MFFRVFVIPQDEPGRVRFVQRLSAVNEKHAALHCASQDVLHEARWVIVMPSSLTHLRLQTGVLLYWSEATGEYLELGDH